MAPIGGTDFFKFYRYSPSIPAAILFIVLFSITTTLHTYQVYKTRNWVCICLAFGSLNEVVSYIMRIFSAKEKPYPTIGLFIAQGAPSLLAPALFAACIYVSLGRIIASVDAAQHSLVRLSLLTRLFVAGDVLGLAVQGAGAIMMPLGGLQNFYTGSRIVIGGLALLVASFALFLVLAVVFHLRLRRQPTSLSRGRPRQWLRDLRVLYVASVLILIRSVYRLIEYSGGNNSWLMRQEWALYVFDSLLMWVVLVLLNIWPPPGRLAKGGGLGGEGEYEARAAIRLRVQGLEVLRSRSDSGNIKPGEARGV